MSYYGLEQYELALNQFQKALDINPAFERARILVATTLLKQKRIEDAVQEIQKVLRVNLKNAYAHNILGSAYLALGEYDQGMAELNKAIGLDPSLADAHLKRGLFHLANGEGALGEADLVKAVAAAPEVLNGRLMLVAHYLRQKNYADAIQSLQEGLNGSKSDALLYNYLAAAYFAQKKNESGVSALLKAKQADDHYLTPYFNLAAYYSSQSQYTEAIKEYKQILAVDTKSLRALLGLAGVYRVQGRTDSVDAVFREMEQTGSEKGFAYSAQYQARSGRRDEALTIVERGLKNFAESVPLLEIEGALLFEKKDLEGAEAIYRRLASIAPERGYSLLVRFYLVTQQQALAEKLVHELMKSAADKEYPYLLEAGYLRSQNKVSEAIEVLKKGMAQLGNSKRLSMQAGRLYEVIGDQGQAARLYQQVVDADGEFSPAYVALGFLRERAGDKAAALEYYRKAVGYDQRNVPALNNLAYLLADNFGEFKEGLDYALMAFRLEPNDPRIMDTVGYLLTQNGRSEEAVKVLDRAHEMLPKEYAVAIHFAQALMATGKEEQGRKLLQDVLKNGSQQEKEAAQKALNAR